MVVRRTSGGGGGGQAGSVNGPPRIVSKAADESIASSTTLQNDDDLTFAVLNGQRWVGQFNVVYAADGTADIKVAIGTPAGSTGVRSCVALGLAVGADEGVMRSVGATNIGGTTDTGNGFGGGSSTGHQLLIVYFNVLAGADGNIYLRWSQATSSATPAIVRAGSSVVAHRLS